MDEIYNGLMRLRGPVAKSEIVGFCRIDANSGEVMTGLRRSSVPVPFVGIGVNLAVQSVLGDSRRVEVWRCIIHKLFD